MDKRTIIAKIDTIVVRSDMTEKDKEVAIKILKHELEKTDKN